MRISIALLSVAFALAGSAVAAPLSVDYTLKTRSKVNGNEPNSPENTVTNPSSSIADFLISLANLMTGTRPGGNATVNIGGSAIGGNGGSGNSAGNGGNAIGGSACINENANGGNGGNGEIAGNGGPGGTILSRNSGSESNFGNEIEDDPDKTNNNIRRGDGTSAVAQAGSNNQICGSSGA